LKILIKNWLLLVVFTNISIFSQTIQFNLTKTDTFSVTYKTPNFLSEFNINPNSLKFYDLYRNSIFPKYLFDSTSNSIVFDSIGLNSSDKILVCYSAVKIPLKKEVFHKKIVQVYDGIIPDSVVTSNFDDYKISNDAIFGEKLNRNGSIIRGITVGSNQDAIVNSGMRLNLSGKISEDVEIVAALTDQSSPLQPEGATESIEEIDKVFIELKHKNANGTFGDFYLEENYGQFAKVNRKLQGLYGKVNFENQNGFFSYASQRGKYTTNEFFGQDGVQGSYLLYGENNEKEIIVIAGTEIVYVDGEKLNRGENNHYTIDYANSSITFTAKKIISKTSRIFVEFEYSDRKFGRSFLSGGGKTNLFDKKLMISASYFSENDNEKEPIDFTLSEDELEILSNAGNNPLNATISGVSLVAEDSNGVRKGNYTKIDSTINADEFSYFVYQTESENAIYNVKFTFVGAGKGDYSKKSTLEYNFIGIGKGSYLPVVFLPLPQKKEIANFLLTYQPSKNLRLNAEISGSNFDRNKFSVLDNDENQGFAWNLSTNYQIEDIKLLDFDFGRIDLNYRDRFIDEKYNSIEKLNSVDFSRNYNLNSQAGNSQVLREFDLKYNKSENSEFGLSYGFLSEGENFSSTRKRINYHLDKKENYNLDLSFNRTDSKNLGISGNFTEIKLNSFYKIGIFRPMFSVLKEMKTEFIISGDTLINQSYNYSEIQPKIEIVSGKNFTLQMFYGYRNDKNPLKNKLENESVQHKYGIETQFNYDKNLRSNLNLSFQQRKYEKIFIQNGMLDNENLIIKSQTNYNIFSNMVFGDIFYSAATEKTAKLQKIFIPVPIGQGEYIYSGDLNSNGIAEDEEFEQVNENGNFTTMTIPTDELFPIVNLRFDAKFKLDFSKISNFNSIFKAIISSISSETFYRIDEKSKIINPINIYLMNQNYFLQDSTTINGSNFIQQDLFYQKNSSEFSVRGRILQRKFLNQYSNGTENGIKTEKSLQIRTKLITEIRNQTEYKIIDDFMISEANESKNRKAETEEINTDFSYRPINNIEVGIKLSVGRTIDNFPEKPTTIDGNIQSIRILYSVINSGKIRFEIERRELATKNVSTSIPFEISQGFSIGKNFIFRINADYKISENLQTTLLYSGKKYGNSDIIHLLQAEARAFF